MQGGDGALPTLRCPRCGSADLHFLPEGRVRCSRCRRLWERNELARETGTPGRHSADVREEDGNGD